MARKWRAQAVGPVLTKLGTAGRGPAPVPRAFRSAADGSVTYRRLDGSQGRASYWAQMDTCRVWAVDVETRSFVTLELHTRAAGEDWTRLHTGLWDNARGESFEIVEIQSPQR